MLKDITDKDNKKLLKLAKKEVKIGLKPIKHKQLNKIK